MSTVHSPEHRRSLRGDLVTDLVEEIFTVNSALMRAGDDIAGRVELTAAAWQVLGLLDDGPATVSALSRRRGLRRQGVQQTVNRLIARELVTTEPNPTDGRAPLVTLTIQGRDHLDRLIAPQATWVESLAAALPSERRVRDALDLLRTMRAHLGQGPHP